MANPKIVYTPAGGTERTLNFGFAPRSVPAYWSAAVRHDNVSTAGLRESVLERIDNFLDFTIEWIMASEVLAWQDLLDYALTGAAFAYYPDAAQPAFTNYVLEDSEARLEYKAPGVYSVKLKMRKQIS